MDHLLYNQIPFKTIFNYLRSNATNIALMNIFGNILMTAPIGFYIALSSLKLNVYIYAFLIPFIIEFVQLSMHFIGLGTRTVDVDDIILNSIGVVLGFVITQLLKKKWKSNSTHKTYFQKIG